MKKEIIMKKALEIFANEGYSGTGVQKIVDAAGVTKPTMYHYYGSKEGLLRSIYETYFTSLIKNIRSIAAYNGDIMNTMESLMLVYIKMAKDEPLFFWLTYHLRRSPKNGEENLIVRHFYQAEHDAVFSIFDAITQYHTNLRGHEEFLILSYLSLINGYIEASLEKETIEQISHHETVLLVKQFLYGIFSL